MIQKRYTNLQGLATPPTAFTTEENQQETDELSNSFSTSGKHLEQFFNAPDNPTQFTQRSNLSSQKDVCGSPSRLSGNISMLFNKAGPMQKEQFLLTHPQQEVHEIHHSQNRSYDLATINMLNVQLPPTQTPLLYSPSISLLSPNKNLQGSQSHPHLFQHQFLHKQQPQQLGSPLQAQQKQFIYPGSTQSHSNSFSLLGQNKYGYQNSQNRVQTVPHLTHHSMPPVPQLPSSVYSLFPHQQHHTQQQHNLQQQQQQQQQQQSNDGEQSVQQFNRYENITHFPHPPPPSAQTTHQQPLLSFNSSLSEQELLQMDALPTPPLSKPERKSIQTLYPSTNPPNTASPAPLEATWPSLQRHSESFSTNPQSQYFTINNSL